MSASDTQSGHNQGCSIPGARMRAEVTQMYERCETEMQNTWHCQ